MNQNELARTRFARKARGVCHVVASEREGRLNLLPKQRVVTAACGREFSTNQMADVPFADLCKACMAAPTPEWSGAA